MAGESVPGGEPIIGETKFPEVKPREFSELPDESSDEKAPLPFQRREITPISKPESSIHAIIDATQGKNESLESQVPEDVRVQIAEAAKAFSNTGIEESSIFSHAKNFTKPGERKVFFEELAKLKAPAAFRDASGAGALNQELLSEQEDNIEGCLEKGYALWSRSSEMRSGLSSPARSAS